MSIVKSFILGLFICFSVVSVAQQATETNTNIIDIDGVETINKNYRKNAAYRGYRLQIYTGSKQKPAYQTKTEFITKFPNIKAYVVYEQPYFKVRIGDCYSNFEAYKLKLQIAEYYPNAFIVKDEIELCK